jgi:hypothetical protein
MNDFQPGALGYLGRNPLSMNTYEFDYDQLPAEGSVRPHCNFVRFGVIMAFHETAMAWFAHD